MNPEVKRLIDDSVYDIATKESIQYKNFEVYSADFLSDSDEPIETGPPAFILTNDGKARWANIAESTEIFDTLIDFSEKNEDDDLPAVLKQQQGDDHAN